MGNIASASVCQAVVDATEFNTPALIAVAAVAFGGPVTVGSFILSVLRACGRQTRSPPTALERAYAACDLWSRPRASGPNPLRTSVSGGLLTVAILGLAGFATFFVLAAGFTSPGARRFATVPVSGTAAGSVPDQHMSLALSVPCQAPEPESGSSRCSASVQTLGPGSLIGNMSCAYAAGVCRFSGLWSLSGAAVTGSEPLRVLAVGARASRDSDQVAVELTSSVVGASGPAALTSLNDNGKALFADACMAVWGLRLASDKPDAAYKISVASGVRRRCLALGVLGPRMICGGSNSFNAPSPYGDTALVFDPTTVDTREVTGSAPPGSIELALLFSDTVLNSGEVTPSWELGLPQIAGLWALAAALHFALRTALDQLHTAVAAAFTEPPARRRATWLGLSLALWYAVVVDLSSVTVWYIASYRGYAAVRPGNNVSDLSWSIATQAVAVAFAVRAVIRAVIYVLLLRSRLSSPSSRRFMSLNTPTHTHTHTPTPTHTHTPSHPTASASASTSESSPLRPKDFARP